MRGHHFDMFYVQTYLLDEIALVFPETAFIRPNTSTIDNILTFISVFCVKALRKFTLLLRRYYRHYSLQTGCCYGSGDKKKYSNETELLKHIWHLKQNKTDFTIKWSIIKKIYFLHGRI